MTTDARGKGQPQKESSMDDEMVTVSLWDDRYEFFRGTERVVVPKWVIDAIRSAAANLSVAAPGAEALLKQYRALEWPMPDKAEHAKLLFANLKTLDGILAALASPTRPGAAVETLPEPCPLCGKRAVRFLRDEPSPQYTNAHCKACRTYMNVTIAPVRHDAAGRDAQGGT